MAEKPNQSNLEKLVESTEKLKRKIEALKQKMRSDDE